MQRSNICVRSSSSGYLVLRGGGGGGGISWKPLNNRKMRRNRFSKSSGVINDLIWLSWAIYPEAEWIPGEPAVRIWKYYFPLLILKMHIIYVLSQLKHKSMSYLIPLIIKHKRTRLSLNRPKLRWVLCCHSFQPRWKHTNNSFFCVSFWWMPGAFSECKCEEAKIHLDFRSPSESIRGGSVSIC